ncbi:hypothetical protein [Achromobacter sp. NFACC18-2]|nr:hypothetical protein [Achromobacter sp. NFACC18-2]
MNKTAIDRQGRSPGLTAKQEKAMGPHTNTMLIIIVTGVALMLIGFGFRDRNLGMTLMGLGLVTAIGAIIYKAYITFY